MFRRALYRGFSLIAESKISKFIAHTKKPRPAQLEKLLQIVRANASSSFGKEHNFSQIKGVEDFRKFVPVRDYEGFRPYIDRSVAGEENVLTSDAPLMYATTSGTTGLPKYVPITPGYMDEFRLASVISGYHLLKTYPGIDRGVSLSVASPAVEGHTPGGTPYGAISGQLFQSEPYLIKKFISPIPYEVYLIKDYETRYYTLLRLAVVLPISLFYTLNPSTISLLCRRLKTYGPSLIKDVREGSISPPHSQDQGPKQGAERGSEQSPERDSERSAEQSPERDSERSAEQSPERDSERGSEQRSDQLAERGAVRNAERGAERGLETRLNQPTMAALKKHLVANKERAAQLQALLESGNFAPHKIWPTLAVVSCWTKAAAAFYLSDFPEHFGAVPVSDITYGASEGRGTVFMGPGQQVLALQSHFFEFIPEEQIDAANPQVLLADEVETGKNYFILFTTSGGLYRYNINDVVKVTGFYNATPILEFQYKGGNVCSFTGEKITELQVTTAVKRAENKVGPRLRFFTMVPRFRPEPHYEVWIEPDGGVNEVAGAGQEQAHKTEAAGNSEQGFSALAEAIDNELAIENNEYKVKRESLRLTKITICPLKPGSYERFRKHLTGQGVADAQIKVSHLNPKDAVRDFFEKELAENQAENQSKSLSNI